MIEDWNRLFSKVVESSSLDIFKTELSIALSNLLEVTLL